MKEYLRVNGEFVKVESPAHKAALLEIQNAEMYDESLTQLADICQKAAIAATNAVMRELAELGAPIPPDQVELKLVEGAELTRVTKEIICEKNGALRGTAILPEARRKFDLFNAFVVATAQTLAPAFTKYVSERGK